MTSPDWELLWGGPGADFLLLSSHKYALISGSGPDLALPLKSSLSTRSDRCRQKQ